MSARSKPNAAWEPLTPRGVAAFAGAGFARLLLVQWIVALLAAGVLTWFVDSNCFPVVASAIQRLPASGEIDSGRFDWMGDSPELLAQGRVLALGVDLNHSGQISDTSDVQIEFGRENVRLISLFGFIDFSYPRGYIIAFNRNELEPLWGAWASEILLMTGGAVMILLLLSWWLLASVYSFPLWLLAFYTNRELNLRQSWRLAGASLMPGALLMALVVLFYSIGFLNLVSLLFAFGAHLVVGWIYLFVSLAFLSRAPDATKRGNPFGNSRKGPAKDDNPFKKKHGV